MLRNEKQKKHAEIIEKKWSNYRVEEYLGGGSYGSVYKCVRTEKNITVEEAIKIIDLEGEGDRLEIEEMELSPERYYADKQQKALDEVRAMVRLKGSHIMHINDYDVVPKEDHPGSYILIRMDLMQSMADVLKEHLRDDQKSAEAFAKKIGRDMCIALKQCEEYGAIHRDIKPGNLFVDKAGEIYLGDFGFARELNSPGNFSYAGSPDFIAPEVDTGNYDHRADIYSLGLVLYCVLNHGRLPFLPSFPARYTPPDKERARVALRTPNNLLPKPDNCSPAFARIIYKMCAYDPAKRYQSAAELETALLSLDLAQKDPKRQTQPHPEKRSDQPAASQNRESGPAAQKPNQGMQNKAAPAVPVYAPARTTPEPSALADTPGRTMTAPANPAPEAVRAPAVQPFSPAKPAKSKRKVVIFVTVLLAALLCFVVMRPGRSNETLFESGQRLTSLTMEEKSNAAVLEDVQNTLGFSFGEAVVLQNSYGSAYATYSIEDYTRIIGTYSCPDNGISAGSLFELTVYLDDDEDHPLLKTDLSRSVTEADLDLDISAGTLLTFRVRPIEGSCSGVLLADCRLFKEGEQIPEPEERHTDPDTPDTAELSEMHIVQSSGASVQERVQNSLGNTFDKAVAIQNMFDNAYARYYVGDYTRITGTYSCPDNGVSSDCQFELCVYLDEDTESPLLKVELTRATAETFFDLDVSNGQFLTFQLRRLKGSHCGLLLSDCFLSRNGAQTPAPAAAEQDELPDTTALTSSHIVQSNGASVQERVQNSLGNTFDKAVAIQNMFDNAYARYYVGDHTRITGTYSCPDNGVSSDCQFELCVYLDEDTESPLLKVELTRATAETFFDLDVSNGQFLTFQLRRLKGSHCGLLLSDCFLSRNGAQTPAPAAAEQDELPDTTALTSSHIVQSNGASVQERVQNSLGNTFDKAVAIQNMFDNAYARYYVGGYTRITGTYSCPDNGVSSDCQFELCVYLDEDTESPLLKVELTRATAETFFDLDVSNGQFLTFRLERLKGSHCGLLLSDCFLSRNGAQTPAPAAAEQDELPDTTALTSSHIVQSNGASVQERVQNSLGNTFDKAVAIQNMFDNAYARYYVGDYTRITGTYSCPDNGVSSNCQFELCVYLDEDTENPLLKVELTRATAETFFDLDVSNGQFLTFQLRRLKGDHCGILLTDCRLYPNEAGNME